MDSQPAAVMESSAITIQTAVQKASDPVSKSKTAHRTLLNARRGNILPFWTRDKWHTTSFDERCENGTILEDVQSDVLPKYIYKRMRPALELASAMFIHSEPYNTRTLCAPILPMDGLLVLDSDYDITPADRKQYRKFLLKLKADVRIHFGSGVAHRLGHPAFAVTSLLDTEPYTPQMLLVEVNRGDLDFYSDPNFDSYSEKHRMKVHFFLATVLCHEAAHWSHSYRVRELGLDWKLLTYNSDHRLHEPEIGFSWTHYFFYDPPMLTNLVLDHQREMDRTQPTDLGIDLSEPIVINALGWNPRMMWNIHSDILEAFFDVDLWDGMITPELKEWMAKTGGSLDLLKTVGMSIFGDVEKLTDTKDQMVLRSQM